MASWTIGKACYPARRPCPHPRSTWSEAMVSRRAIVPSFAFLLTTTTASPSRAQEELWRHDGASNEELTSSSRVVGIGDLDGDGLPDLLIGSFQSNGYDGIVVGLRGRDGSVLFTLDGSGQEHFGTGL